MRISSFSFLVIGGLLAGPAAGAATLRLPLELRQDATPYNLQSPRGMPLSPTPGNPPGSDGRAPTRNDQLDDGLTTVPPTPGRFQNLLTWGGTTGRQRSDWQDAAGSAELESGDTAFSQALAERMHLPLAETGDGGALILRRAQIGASYLSRRVSFAFGAIVEVPKTDERGVLLQDVNKEDYWLPEPYTTTGHENSGYYWSPNARKVFAVQPGPLFITWIKATPYTAATFPADYENPLGPNSVTKGLSVYLLYTKRYVVSGSPVKPPRKIYWTERGFRRLGKPVAVPPARVGSIHIVYNNNFPKTVDQEHREAGDSLPTDGTSNEPLPELRTLWYDRSQGSIYAYNREGRVFVELLGDARPDGQSREHLGFEIVDVFKQPTPADVTVELGERIVPPSPGTVEDLIPEPVLQTGKTFAYQHQPTGAPVPEYYATRETRNLNDYLVHWMERGEQGLLWPAFLGRYHLIWPTDASRYSHYLRLPAATEEEARETAVVLSTQNVPAIAYQDPLDWPRAKLTEDFKFFTWLDEAHPAHRTLLRFISGDEVAFERVFSWLDTAVLHPNFTLPGFYSDFTTPPGNATAYGNARVEGGVLHLTDDQPGQAGTYVLKRFSGNTPVESFKAAFKVRIQSSKEVIASGFSFNFGTAVAAVGEDGIAQGLAVCFDSFDYSVDDVAPTIAIKYNGVILAAVQMAEPRNPHPEPAYVLPAPKDPATGQPMTLATGDRFVPVEIVLHRDGRMDVSYKGVKVLRNVATGYGPRTGRFLFGARTKPGFHATHWIDELAVVVNQDTPAGPSPFAHSVATDLDAWIADTTFYWPDKFVRPRVVKRTVDVGQRINAPADEPGATGDYLAGYINRRVGTSYDPTAYVDPFAQGFSNTVASAIIPVNAIPGKNRLEVWWFRLNGERAGLNAGSAEKGFATIYWPSVVGHYTLQWPANAREIILASNAGSGALSSLEAKGTIYRQPDPDADGYNPNEEHAILAGGSAYATRDDLNITAGADYSSEPFVLVRYTAADGRPAITPFRVLRERPAEGYVFDYVTPAGRLLQPPMPLPLLAKPVVGSGDAAYSLNTEPDHGVGDVPGGWDPARDANGPYGYYAKFTWEDRHHDFWVYRGLHAGLPTLEAGSYDATTETFNALPAAKAVAGKPFRYTVHVSRRPEILQLSSPNLPDWLRVEGMSLVGTPTAAAPENTVDLKVYDPYNREEVTLTLRLRVAAAGAPVAQPPLALLSTNPYTGSAVLFTNRPPYLAASPRPTNSFTMRYYYRTEPSFDWPGVVSPPPPGSIVPYLRPVDPATGAFVGDPAAADTEALEIVYRPVWPVRDPSDSSKPLPTLPLGATLTTPRNGLPGVRGMLTARVLYQQSIARHFPAILPSVVLCDPTREKQSDLETQGLSGVPGGVHKIAYQGRWFFPDLPPHLVKRVFYDPHRGRAGALVLRGEFVKETLGEDYLLLNVLRGDDADAVMALCPDADPDKSQWDALVEGMAAVVETFRESPTAPGTYEPDPARTTRVELANLVEINDDNTAVDSYAISATGPGAGYVTLVEAGGTAFTRPGDPIALHIFKVGGDHLYRGELKVILADNPMSEKVTLQHTADLAGRSGEFEYEWKIAAPVDGLPPEPDADMSHYQALSSGRGQPRYTLGGVGIRTLADNYVVMRYRAKDADHPLYNAWSEWTAPALAEGWIKRVLGGINPFNQRIKDLFNHQVNTDVSLLTQAGTRWEGDVALNLENINEHGLIEIYETVLRRGRALSIEAGYNYGPANDALLLAAGYLNDLYMMLGNEAWADAANPTIGIGTANRTYGDIATALFAFKGQEPSLLEEELALLRGRDDFLLPGVEVAPVYNRLVWNYTRGIDAGEVIYALNYNIREDPNHEPDGVINAEDAARMFPQGHGDAYGHYLTALTGYYSLLMNNSFDWVPRIEAVNVLGKPVSVDYLDERKFAAAAVSLARAGRQVFDLTLRRDYQPDRSRGWSYLSATRINPRRSHASVTGQPGQPSVRYWGADHWACRTGQGAYLNWIVGNAILPATDPDPHHEGIQKIDRTTVPELRELVTAARDLQTGLDNAEGGLTPLGVPEGSLAFDLNPARMGGENGTHFEQIYQRAKTALNNAVAAFDDAKDVTAMMRSEQDSLADFRAAVARQEQTFNNALIELYGTPYPEDIGPGKLYPQGYSGPDLLHYMYVEIPEQQFPELWSYTEETDFRVDVQDLPDNWSTDLLTDLTLLTDEGEHPRQPGTDYIEFHIGSHGYFDKPSDWHSRRASPGRIQQAISEYIMAHTRLRQALNDAVGAKNDLDKELARFHDYLDLSTKIWNIKLAMMTLDETLQWVQFANDIFQKYTDSITEDIQFTSDAAAEALPGSMIAGVASGGDLTSAGRAAIEMAGYAVVKSLDVVGLIRYTVVKALENAIATTKRQLEFWSIGPLEWEIELKERVMALGNQLGAVQEHLWTINERLRQLDDAARKRDALIAQGERIQDERRIFRQHAAAVIQGYRTRDAGFRLFRNEKLERYQTLFDLAARYALLAANAYDYETGLLNTSAGKEFIRRIISARALGVVRNGEPQYAGSNTGDPGLSSALAEMKADWDVLRGRLGFNNPDAYGTTVSLRTEAYRILPTSDGDSAWQDLLQSARTGNLLDDADVRRYCLQIDAGDGLPVPGLVLTFQTTIADGLNLFGKRLAAGDHAFSPSSFATKIFAVGVALEGYRGMDEPAANSAAVAAAGGVSPAEPSFPFLDPLALSATPYVYLVPVGVDSLRTPPLGDAGAIRTWRVADVAIPMPFNIGASDFSTRPLWQSADSLTEPLFAIRKHQAFRPVGSAAKFNDAVYLSGNAMRRSQYTNNRLIGRSVWNSQWKLIIPGRTLLNDPNEGLDRFIQTVKDIKLRFVTYSYSGN